MGDVRWMFHATAMGPDYDGILGPLARLFGCRVLHRQQLDEPVGRDGGMTWIGDNSIEIGAPYGEGSSVATFVERLGGGMHSVAVQVPDVAATLARLAPLGVEVASRISDEIVFTRSGGTAGLVLEWASHVQDDDPRWGAPVPAFVARAGRQRGAHGVRRCDRARSRSRTVSVSPRSSTRDWSRMTTSDAPDVRALRARSRRLHARALPDPARRGDEPRGVGRRVRASALSRARTDRRRPGCGRTRARRRRCPRPPPRRATGAWCSSTAFRSRSCSPTSCSPAIRARHLPPTPRRNHDHPRRTSPGDPRAVDHRRPHHGAAAGCRR